jgi:uncharacterized protein (DUF885 family)
MARYRDLLAGEVAERARPDDRCGLAHVPGGQAVYLAAVAQHTTTDRDPAELHQLGLDLVATLAEEYRALGERVLGTADMDKVLDRLRHDPALRFGSAAEILQSGRDALDRAVAALPAIVGRVPAAPCRVDEMSAYEAKDAVLGYYQPAAADGSHPGVHWLNTSAPETRTRYEYEALAFHESVPGHHLQFALAQELEELPRFRRFGYVTAFSEGWALYTERLADEIGLYSGDLERFGMLSFDSWRACRLVGRHRPAPARLEPGPGGRLHAGQLRPDPHQHRERGRPLRGHARPGAGLHGRPPGAGPAPGAGPGPPWRPVRPARLPRPGARHRRGAAVRSGRGGRRHLIG